MEVLMLEAGPPRIPTRDFTEHAWPYQLKFRGFRDQKKMLTDQPVQSLCYACDEYSHQFFVNDTEHPYTFPAGKPFMWIRCRQVGRQDISAGLAKVTDTPIMSSRPQAAMDTARTGPSAMRSLSRTTTR